jgi:hypothetical protein
MTFPLNWNIYKADGATTVSIEQSLAIIGHGSLNITTVNPDRVTLYNNSYTPGLLAGTIGTIINIPVHIATARCYVGLVFMQNVPQINLVTSAGYGVFFSALSGLTSPRISIVKFTTGLPTSPVELAFTTSFTPPTLGGNFVFSALWTSSFAGTSIIAQYALGTNFTALSSVLTVNDVTSPIVTTSYESLAVSSTGTGTFTALFDQTSIYDLV